MQPREYQYQAVGRVSWALRAGARSVLLVAPTGAGKTFMGAMLVAKLNMTRTIWVTHTKDLVKQSADKLRAAGLNVGMIAGGYTPNWSAPVQIASIQSLLSREITSHFDLMILDEAHHYMAADWRASLDALGAKKTIGLTATPERGDKQPLGDIFEELVVAAHYSELIAQGHLVPCRVLGPRSKLDKGVAKKPLEAYMKCGEGRFGFAYARSVADCEAYAAEAHAAGVPSSVVSYESSDDHRAWAIGALGERRLRLLWNVSALSEGVDVPEASLALIGRSMGNMALYLQTCGRVLRPSEGKTEALILDLPGLVHVYGPPTQDRDYSLSGEAIRKRAGSASLRICVYCGMTFEPKGDGACPRCGEKNPSELKKPIRIYNQELAEVFRGADTPAWAKKAEWDRLVAAARTRGFSLGWAKKQFELTFNDRPHFGVTDEQGDALRREEFSKLLEKAKKLGYKPGWASHRYKAVFGAYPPRSWVA